VVESRRICDSRDWDVFAEVSARPSLALEECDDGNDVAGDGCEADCTVTSEGAIPR
jgi:cysteine-rich repeat protein